MRTEWTIRVVSYRREWVCLYLRILWDTVQLVQVMEHLDTSVALFRHYRHTRVVDMGRVVRQMRAAFLHAHFAE